MSLYIEVWSGDYVMPTHWTPEFNRQDVDIIEDLQVFSGYCPIKRYRLRFKLFAGGLSNVFSREVLYRPPAAAVLLYDKSMDSVLLIEQFRVGALGEKSPWVLEIVAGVIDENDNAEETAYRESLEEAGCEILTLIPIHTCIVSPGVSSEISHIYCGLTKLSNKHTYHGLLEEGEDIKTHIISTNDALAWLKQGKIKTAPAIIALQWLALNREHLPLPQ